MISKERFWKRIIRKKYIAPDTLLDWTSTNKKSVSNVSNQWRALTLSFPIIGTSLSWKVGDGTHVRVGCDVIMWCQNEVYLHGELIQYLQDIGRCKHNMLGHTIYTTFGIRIGYQIKILVWRVNMCILGMYSNLSCTELILEKKEELNVLVWEKIRLVGTILLKWDTRDFKLMHIRT